MNVHIAPNGNLHDSTRLGVLSLLIAGLCSIAPAATLTGTITDLNGTPLPNAQIVLTASPASLKNSNQSGSTIPHSPDLSPVSSASVTSSSGGIFTIPNVAAGKYVLCINPADRSHVNSCLSRLGAESIEVLPETLSQTVDVKAIRGSEVVLTVILNQETGKLPTHAFLVASNGTFCPMAKDAASGQFWTVVPPQSDWQLVTSVAGGRVSLPSESLHAGAAGVPVTLTVIR